MDAFHLESMSLATPTTLFRLALTALVCIVASWPIESDAQSMSVSAIVLSSSNCKFRPGSATTLPFGTIDPSGVVTATATAVVIIRCGGSAGTAIFALSADDGLFSPGAGTKRMRHGLTFTQYMTYTVNLPASASIPKNFDTNLTITGSVAVANFQNSIAGNYSDTLALTLLP